MALNSHHLLLLIQVNLTIRFELNPYNVKTKTTGIIKVKLTTTFKRLLQPKKHLVELQCKSIHGLVGYFYQFVFFGI